jgi:hypothetical protein
MSLPNNRDGLSMIHIIRGLFACLVFSPLSHAALQQAYLWADQPQAASYSPSATYLSAAAAGATITRTGPGRYRVSPGSFLGAAASGDGSRGTVHVTAYGGAPVSCQVVSWSTVVNVACFDRAGAPADSRFSLLLVRAGAGEGVAYAWSGRPAEPNYIADRAYALGGDGAGVRIERSAPGAYRVTLGDVLAAAGGNVQVSAYGSTPRRCQVARWSGGKAFVSCRDASGAPADAAFTVLAVGAAAGREVAYAWSGDAAARGALDATYASVPGGGAAAVSRAGAGRYSVSLGSGVHNVQVTSYGDDGAHCVVDSWGAGTAKVSCFDAAGAPKDSRFSVLAANMPSAVVAPSAPTNVVAQPVDAVPGSAPTQSAALRASTAGKAAPLKGSEHPFFRKIPNVVIEPQLAELRVQPSPAFTEAISPRKRPARVRVGSETLDVTLEATPEVSEAMLNYLAANLSGTRVNGAARTELQPFLSRSGPLERGQPEVRLPQIAGVMLSWPDGWEMARPNVLRVREAYRRAAPRETPPRSAGGGVGVSVQALTGTWTTVEGQIQCQAPDDPAPTPLPFVRVTVAGQTLPAGRDGRFSFSGTFTEVNSVNVNYDGRVTPVPGVAEGPRISVMNDFHNPRGEDINGVSGATVGSVLQLALPALTSLDCELFQIGAAILQEFHDQTRTDPPAADDFRIKRWEGIDTVSGTTPITPHAYHDYVVIAKDFRRFAPSREGRVATLTHEFGHTLRHAADGDAGHWGWDNFRWAYGRFHDGNEIANEQYAFNEGFAHFWECSRSAIRATAADAASCVGIAPPVPAVSELDWNEKRVGERLLAMSRVTDVGRVAMLQILRDNPGVIHTFRGYETRYCTRFPSNSFCRSGTPVRAKRECPTNYHDDGATCRFDNILAKNSYGRGVGTIPGGCGGAQNDAGLCYEPCRAGFDGVGPVCWRRCPAGMHDDGAFCRRDVDIRTSDNSRCGFWDRCGLTFERGCSVCPAGFQNDGCFCRRDAWIFAKETYGRGVGTIPTQCPAGQEYDAGLCYPRCRAGFNGVGPVCWGSCPAGYADHGATCYRDPQVIVKY